MTEPKDFDWRFADGMSVVQRWNAARTRGFRTDVDFLVGEDSSTAVVISAHRLVMAMNSPVFEAMFSGVWKEENMKTPIRIIDIDANTFTILLRHMYGEKIEFKDSKGDLLPAGHVFLAAEKYLMVDLQKIAEEFIEDAKILYTDFYKLIETPELWRIPVLYKKGLLFASSRALIVLSESEVIKLPLHIFKDIVQLNFLCDVNEFYILLAIGHWSRANTEVRTYELLCLLKHVRFHQIKRKQFCCFLDQFPNFIRPKDCIQIFKYLITKNMRRLPKWCTRRKACRCSLRSI